MFKPVTPSVDFPQMERDLLKKWEDKGIVGKYLHRNDTSTKRFSFLDGPITANNPMGVHHAWGRTYKDLWQRFYNMRGYKERFQNGFDCQGLWVEVEVEKELGVRNKKDIENLIEGDKKKSIAKFVELCKDRVFKFSKIQTEQSKRLGYFMDWDNSYYTMSDENNYMIWHFLKTCFEKGWIYKGRESVAWCPRCETAISQHEMLTEDYKELVHESIYLELPIKGKEREFLLIWTTTPWTLPANVAVAVNAKMDYSLVEDNTGKLFWIAKDAVERIFKKDYKKIVKTVKGKELVGYSYTSPFDDLKEVKKLISKQPDKFHIVIATDDQIMPINSEEGTGLVHTAVSAGVEDFRLGKKHGLPMIEIIADNADYLPSMDFLAGKNAKKHPEIIFDYLKEREDKHKENWIYALERYKHRYPACWRCKTELVWKVTDEWYIAMDKKENGKGRTLREQMVDTAKMIDWHPSFGLERELDWLKNMHDWLISKKNRYWGLALPIYECLKCGHFEIIGSREELKERSVEGWEELEGHSPHKPYIDEVKIKCSECGEIVSRIDDVGNVWLDAGIVPFSTYIDPKTDKLSYTMDKRYWRDWFPADFITESFPGQFKNWFYSLIAMSTVLEKKNPFKTILGYSSALAEDGKPMHKSWGNSIEFNEGADKIGVDVMRWMYVSADPEQNLLFGYKKADETRRRFYLMLWNTYNFFVTYANIDKWDNKIQNSKFKIQNILDKWIVSRLNGTTKTVTESLVKYDAQKAAISIENFVNDLSLWYVRRSRSRVGPSAEAGEDKNDFYQTLHLVFLTLSKLMAPSTPFITDEIYVNLSNEQSVHLADFPEYDESLINKKLEDEMKNGREVASIILMRRKLAGVKVRTPIKKLSYTGPAGLSDEIKKIVLDEVNVGDLEYRGKSSNFESKGDSAELTDLSNQDVVLGEAREIVRMIQDERKKLGTALDEKIDVILPTWPVAHEEYIKKQALISSIVKGDKLEIVRIK